MASSIVVPTLDLMGNFPAAIAQKLVDVATQAKADINGGVGGAPLSNATPQQVGTANSGVSTSASRDDHVHAAPNVVSGGAAGFITGADKAKLDGIASGAEVCTQYVQACNSTVASSTQASGYRYYPLRHSNSDYADFQFVAWRTGTISVKANYAMSSASASGVRLRLDWLQVGAGDNPATAATTGTAFTVSASSDTLLHQVTSSSSADFAVSVTADKTVYLRFNRLGSDGADTHVGDFQLYELRLV